MTARYRAWLLRRLLCMCALACGLGSALPAWAVCTYTDTGGQLGSFNSFRVLNGPAIATNANFRLYCGLSLLGAISTSKLQVSIVSPTTGLTLKKAGSSYAVPYQITTPGGASYTQGLLILDLNGTNVLSILTGNATNLPISILTLPGANVPAGTYTDTITVNWNYANICQGAAVLNACVGVAHTDNTNRTITVQLEVTNDCTIAAPDIAFGQAPLPSAFPTVSQSLSVLCTRDVAYSVGLGPGSYPSGGRRQMASGANRLAYDIFRPDSTVWGTAAGARVTTAISNGLTPLLLPYSARVYPDQTPPPLGVYQDSVLVEVQF